VLHLFDYQIPAKDRLVNSLRVHGAALDASATGVGKTITALFTAKELGLPILVVCPKAVIPSWKAAAAKVGVKLECVINYELIRNGRTKWLKKEARSLIWTLSGRQHLIIFDEVHRCKALDSINAKMLIAAKRNGHRVLMLSATAASSPLDLRSIGYVLGVHKLHDFYAWAHAHGARRNRWNGWDWDSEQGYLSMIHDQIFPAKGVRIRISELGDRFPENTIIAEALQIENSASLEAMYEEAAQAIKDAKDKKKEATEPFVKILRARQESELRKVPLFVDMVGDLVEEGNSVAIFVNYSETLTLLSQYLETDCVVWGENKGDEREEAIQKFQSGESKIIICNIQAGGASINLHDEDGRFPRVALISPTFSAVDLKQCFGRCHRANGKSKVIQKVVYAAGTCEEAVCKQVQDKLSNLDMLNDNDSTPETLWQKN